MPARKCRWTIPPRLNASRKGPSPGALLPASLMYFCSGQLMHFSSGEFGALGEQIRSPIAALDVRADSMGERHFDKHMIRPGALMPPIAERRSEPWTVTSARPMRWINICNAPPKMRSPRAPMNKCGLSFSVGSDLNRSIAGADSGTRCSRPPFMRFAGTVQPLFSRSISGQVAPNTSFDLAAFSRESKRLRANPLALAQFGQEARQFRIGQGGWVIPTRSFCRCRQYVL